MRRSRISPLARRFQHLPASGLVAVEPAVERLLKPLGLSSRLEGFGLSRLSPSVKQILPMLTQAAPHRRRLIECVSDRMLKWQVEQQTT